jgi:prevent-host-death family protein
VPDTSFFQFLRESNFPILAGSEKVQGANLAGYDLSGASLIKADLSGVLWDDKTKWPDNAAFKDAKNIPPDLKNLRQERWGLLLAFGLRRRLPACAGPSLSHSTRHGDQSLGHPMPPTHQTAVQDFALLLADTGSSLHPGGVSASEANRSFSTLLRQVAQGQRFTVLSHGRPVATIAPAVESTASLGGNAPCPACAAGNAAGERCPPQLATGRPRRLMP